MPLRAQGQVHVAVRKLMAAYGDEVGSITTTGHSLGEPGLASALQSSDDALAAQPETGWMCTE